MITPEDEAKCLLYAAHRTEVIMAATDDLTNEQIAALPRLVAWFRDRVDVFSIFDPESKQLREIYPPK